MQNGNYSRNQRIYVDSILQANKDKSFVKRIFERSKYPTIKNNDGTFSTHKMAWGEADGKYYVFPTILFDGKGLQQFEPQDAFKQTMKTNNFIEFKTSKEADWFSKNYKLIWK